MTIRGKLLSVIDRFSTMWRVLISRSAITLEQLDASLGKLDGSVATLSADLPEQIATRLNEQTAIMLVNHLAAHGQTQAAMGAPLANDIGRLAASLQQKEAEAYKVIGDLRGFAWVVYSQNGEDGILKEIFRRIGTTNQFFVEFGVESGVQCNTRYLAELLGWSGVYFEPSDTNFVKLQAMWQGNDKIQTYNDAITSQNFEEKLAMANVPKELDLLVIDIDSNDYWVWKALTNWSPRVVTIEYNSFYDPPRKWVMKEDLNYSWNQTTYFGASFTSFYKLGQSKGYRLVGTDPKGVNMFFVREDCMNDQFLDPALYYFFQPFGYTRPPSFDGPHEEI